MNWDELIKGFVQPPHCRTLRENQPWASPKVSERYLTPHHYPTVGQVSPRTRKSMSLDMGQPSHANTKKLLGMASLNWTPCPQNSLKFFLSCIFLVFLGTRNSFDHLISDSKAPKRQETESGMTTPLKIRRVGENNYEIGVFFQA